MEYIIFGAGDTGRDAIDVFGRENIRFFIDNSPQKQKSGFEGFEVLSLEDARRQVNDSQVVIAVTRTYEDEIRKQLLENGINNATSAQTLIFEKRRKRIEERPDYIEVYKKAVKWIYDHVVELGKGKGIAVCSTEMIPYPEVTGYYIPTLIKWGHRELAASFVRGLISTQRSDGAWNGPHGDTPYVFDTAQILKGLIAAKDMVDGALEAAIKGADWILSNMHENGRLTTPDMTEWGDDNKTCSELIHLYCLSPLVELTEITGVERYRDCAKKITVYYLREHRDKILEFRHLSHFHAYLMEALLDLNENDFAKEAMKNIQEYQRESGAVPAYNDCKWVCSTGLFQLALVWFRMGDFERGNKAFYYAIELQNESGGWYGSYVSEEEPSESNNYFPLGEISWANKYFLDALYYKCTLEFEDNAGGYLDSIDATDGRYKIVSQVVKKITTGKVLEVGCGKGRYLSSLKKEVPNLSYYGVDISKNVLQYVDEKIARTERGTLTCIPDGNDTFDVTFTCEALEHAIDIPAAIREMARVTKKNGTIVIVDKNKARLGAFEIGEWEQWFDINELCEEMSKYCGEVSYVDSIPYENLEADGLFVAWIGKVK